MSKPTTLLLIAILTASSLIMTESAFAQSIPEPATPKFEVYLVNHPYDVPPVSPTYTTDPYTGDQKLLNPGSPGYRVDNVSIELWIQNDQPNYLVG